MSVKSLSLLLSFFAIGTLQADQNVDLEEQMKRYTIIPAYCRHAPPALCRVFYEYGEVHPGEEWLCNRTSRIPNVTWPADPNSHYCLYFGSIHRFDVESLLHPYTRRPLLTTLEPPKEVRDLWVVTNIPGNNLTAGKSIVFYTQPGPPIHEDAVEYYIFSVYKQPTSNLTVSLVEFKESGIYVPDTENLTKLEIEYDLGKPIAGNFFIMTGKGMWDRIKEQ